MVLGGAGPGVAGFKKWDVCHELGCLEQWRLRGVAGSHPQLQETPVPGQRPPGAVFCAGAGACGTDLQPPSSGGVHRTQLCLGTAASLGRASQLLVAPVAVTTPL